MPTAPRDRRGFQVAVFCALPLEAENVQSVFDVCWEDEGTHYGKALGDQNAYTTGVIERHHVVLVHMPSMGGNSAALAAAGLRSSFPRIQLALVVGICGVVPVHPATKKEIILGDVIISTALIQYDFGRQYPNGYRRKDGVEDSLGRASPEIRSFINRFKTRQNRQRFDRQLGHLIKSDEFQIRVPAVVYPGVIYDRLYEASYEHRHYSGDTCDKCLLDLDTCSSSCDELGCGSDRLVTRVRHTIRNQTAEGGHAPCVHFGRFGSANTVLRSGLDRDRMSAADEVSAFEMEGAGVWEQYPTLVIKGACDYADSHKTKSWQDHAAAMAAAALKVFLKEWVNPDQTSDIEHSPQPLWHIPFDREAGFIGRGVELRILEEKLLESSGHRIVSLLGLGGVGKSRLALELAYQIKWKHPQWSIFWVQASDQSSLEKDMLDIGRKLGIVGIDDEKADVKALVCQRLSLPSGKRWLLLLDNADDEALWGRRSNSKQQEPSLADYLPRTTNGAILVTTRTRRVASFLSQKDVISLDAMSREEAAELFTVRLEEISSSVDGDLLMTLVDKLTNLPLAIVQAASFVNMTGTTIETYIELLDQPEVEVVRLLSKDFGDMSRYADAINPVASTWLISFERIRKHHALAANMLSAMACMHEKGIPLSLLPETDSKLDHIEALAVLTGYSFVTRQSDRHGEFNGEPLYNIHHLVHLAARNWLTQEGSLSRWIQACTVRLVQVLPTDTDQHRNLWIKYSPHVQRVAGERDQENSAERYDLLEKFGTWLLADGKYEKAVEVRSAVLKHKEQMLGTSDDDTLQAYDALGVALDGQGSYAQAETYLRAAVDGRLAILGKSNLRTMSSMNNLATTLESNGKYVEAETILREVLRLREEVMGKDHPTTLNSMSNLALVLDSQGKYAEAEIMHREALRRRKIVLGDNNLSTLGSMNNLAAALEHQGKHIEAEETYRKVCRAKEGILGSEHPSTLTSMNNLACVLKSQDKHAEAEKLHREVLQRSEIVLGKSHVSTIDCLHNLASALRSQGKYVEAEGLYREVLRSRERALGRNHPLTLTTMNNLALILDVRGEYAEAEKMHRETLQLRNATLGASHPDTLDSMNNLAVALRRQGRYVEAEEVHRDTLQTRERVLGKDHPDTLTSMSNLAIVLDNMGRYDEAEEMHREVLRLTEKVLGKNHSSTLTSMHNLASILRSQGKYVQAEEMQREELRITRSILGANHPDTLTSMNSLALTLYYQERNDEAEEIYRELVPSAKLSLGMSHTLTYNSMNNLALVLDNLSKYAEAEEIYRDLLRSGEGVLDKTHPDTLTTMNNLASALESQGKNIEAEEIYRETLQLRETALGKKHPLTLTSMNNLAFMLDNQGKYAEAATVQREVLQISEDVLGKDHPSTLISVVNLAWALKAQDQVDEAIDLMRSCAERRLRTLGSDHPRTQAALETLAAWLPDEDSADGQGEDTEQEDETSDKDTKEEDTKQEGKIEQEKDVEQTREVQQTDDAEQAVEGKQIEEKKQIEEIKQIEEGEKAEEEEQEEQEKEARQPEVERLMPGSWVD